MRAEVGMRQTFRCPSPRDVIGADREQPGVFALRAGIRLQGNGVIAGDLRTAMLPVAPRCACSLPPARGAKGCRAPNSGQSPGSSRSSHSASSCRSRAESSHGRAPDRGPTAAHVTHHLDLGAIFVETPDGSCTRSGAVAPRRERHLRASLAVWPSMPMRATPASTAPLLRGLVQRNGDRYRPPSAKVEALGRPTTRSPPPRTCPTVRRVKERFRRHHQSAPPSARRQSDGHEMHPLAMAAGPVDRETRRTSSR